MGGNCFPFVPILPGVYDRALSYEEQLHVFANQIEKLAKKIDDFDLNGVQAVLKEFKTQMTQFEETITNNQISFQTKLNDEVAAFLLKYTKDIETLQENINAQAAYLNAGNKEYVDSEIAKIKAIIAEMETDFNNIIVYNPYRGYTTTLQQWINDNTEFNKRCGVTAGEYDKLQWNANKYDNKIITAFQYDFEFKCIFTNIINGVINPFTGLKDSVQNVINKLASLHYIGITAGSYSALNLTAADYDGKNLSAYNYNFTNWEE